MNTNQGVINSTGTETIENEPKFSKLLRALKPVLVSYNEQGSLVFLACMHISIDLHRSLNSGLGLKFDVPLLKNCHCSRVFSFLTVFFC